MIRCIMPGVTVVLAGLLACGHAFGQKAGSVGLDPRTDMPVLRQALDILEAKAAEEQNTDLGRQLGRQMAALERLLASQPDSHIRKGGLPTGTMGLTSGHGDGEHFDNKWVTLAGHLFNGDCCAGTFIILMDTLAHESTHVLQPSIPSLAPAQVERLKDTDPAVLTNKKIQRINDEISAREFELSVFNEFMSALNQVCWNIKNIISTVDFADPQQQNQAANVTLGDAPADDQGQAAKTPIPGWAKRWFRCCNTSNWKDTRDKLMKLCAFAQATRQFLVGKLRDLRGLKRSIQDGRDRIPPINELTLEEWVDDTAVYKSSIGDHASIALTYGHYSSLVFGSQKDGCNWVLDTGIEHLQDVEVIFDHHGTPYLLACGITSLTVPSGVVRTFPVPGATTVVTPQPPGTIGLVEVPFATSGATTTASNNPFLTWPTSVISAPDGRQFVWDRVQTALYPLVDDDGDGIPDRIDPHSVARVPRGLHLENYAAMAWVGDQPVLQLRMGDTMDFGDDDVIVFEDPNHNGFFENVHTTTWRRMIEADLH